jgi:uncharacterized protein
MTQQSVITASAAAPRPVTVITGGSRGIGYALAERFAAAGHDLVLVARDPEGLQRAQVLLSAASGRRVLTLACDVTDAGAADVIGAFVEANGAYVDHLINNAASWSYEPFTGLSPGDIARLIGTNMTSAITLIHHFLPGMIARKSGRVLNVGSLAGTVPAAGCSLYSGTKTFVEMMTRALQRETTGTGVSVSLLLPGVVDTGFTQELSLARQGRPSLLFRLAATNPAAVAEAAYLGLMTRQRVIVPGLSAQVLYVSQKLIPASLAALLFQRFSARLFTTTAAAAAAR